VLFDEETLDGTTLHSTKEFIVQCRAFSASKSNSLNAQGMLLSTKARAMRIAANFPFDPWKETVNANA
jgi:hypothetical protein